MATSLSKPKETIELENTRRESSHRGASLPCDVNSDQLTTVSEPGGEIGDKALYVGGWGANLNGAAFQRLTVI